MKNNELWKKNAIIVFHHITRGKDPLQFNYLKKAQKKSRGNKGNSVRAINIIFITRLVLNESEKKTAYNKMMKKTNNST